jgi:hypothetical protein
MRRTLPKPYEEVKVTTTTRRYAIARHLTPEEIERALTCTEYPTPEQREEEDDHGPDPLLVAIGADTYWLTSRPDAADVADALLLRHLASDGVAVPEAALEHANREYDAAPRGEWRSHGQLLLDILHYHPYTKPILTNGLRAFYLDWYHRVLTEANDFYRDWDLGIIGPEALAE